MKKLLLALTIVSAGFASCKKDHDAPKEHLFKGPEQIFQHGKAWTWFQTDENDKPLRIAVAIDDAAMSSLDTGHVGDGGHDHANMLSLAFHPKAAITPFQHFGLDWNPHGHEPAGVYDKPHFDFHFYMISETERMGIPPYENDSLKFKNYPAPGYMPANYVPIPGGVPQMGTHWVDVTAAELNGQPFTQTFLNGSYNGNVIFYEPMITRAFIQANATYERAVPQPAKVQKDGYYPKKMKIEKGNGVTNIILEDFVYRTKS
ncbi:DUF5602 domain-containing protein [Chitinophaga eiseniae]|uniref:DUF5602 domain-containing protein n=1 Tax=Chitinophaga eiseniae TaxID=634771 RepID=A0A847SBK3_9BACT|nr:DUF5602 domain-containing protein [Chitinophaga eiseniae]NLR80580.1 DUF5602 domain-containing protein [Chitinophaga eiseniae]